MRAEAWPDAATPDELHDALLWLTFLTEEERARQSGVAAAHGRARGAGPRRAARRRCGTSAVGGGRAARAVRAARPASDESLIEIVRGRLEGLGPVTARRIAESLGIAARRGSIAALAALRGARDLRCAAGSPPVSRRVRGRVVRAAVARAHSSLHRQASARRDRAGAGPGFPAVSLFEWQRVLPECAHAGAGCAWRRCSLSSRGSRRPRAHGRRRSCPRASPSTSRSGWMSIAARGGSCGRGSRARDAADPERGRGASPVRSTPITLAGEAQCAAVVGVDRRSDPRSPDLESPAPCADSSESTAPRSSTRSPSTSACCRSRSRRRSPNSSRSAW